MNRKIFFLLLLFTSVVFYKPVRAQQSPRVKILNGVLEGTYESGINVFKGIPFAAPPVGDLRWKAPQPVKNWTGVRKATQFGPRAMQLPVFGDMNFRSNGMSEDCLYLNVWAPANVKDHKLLPVLVYYYGGGFIAGDGSEYRYDGESMARRGIVSVTVNYRLGVFGFFSYPGLTKEASYKGCGNYGLMDQVAALQWVQKNIAAFGGDPRRITIAGESAGSFSVSALMASPLSKNIIAGAIGESGSLLGNGLVSSLQNAEKSGETFAKSIQENSLEELRAMPAEDLLKATSHAGFGTFPVDVDGYFFPKQPLQIYESGQQAHVPLLVGWNSEEMNYHFVLGSQKPTVENFENAIKKRFGDQADALLSVYHAANDSDVEKVATAFASDQFIAFGTWKWSEEQSKTGTKPVYQYFFERARPEMRSEMGNAVAGLAGGVIRDTAAQQKPKPPIPKGAVHSAEIEYALGNLPSNRVYDWQADDYKVSDIMQTFFENFIKTGSPNGITVPYWPRVDISKPVKVMHVNVNTRVETEKTRDRYLLLDKMNKK